MQFEHILCFSKIEGSIIPWKENVTKWWRHKKVFKGAVKDIRYFARSKFFMTLVHKKNFSLIWQVVFKFLEFISHLNKAILYVNTHFVGNQSWNKKTFSIDVEKNSYFNLKLKLLWINSNFSQFHEYIFRSSCLQMFFKIRALKYLTILRIKKRLQHRCFPVRSNH